MDRHRLKACTRIDIHLHHCAVGSQVKYGSSTTAPSRIASATRRDLPFSTDRRFRELPYVNLGAAGLIGYIRQEMAIRRKPAEGLIVFGCEQRRRFLRLRAVALALRVAIAFERKHPDVELPFRIRHGVVQKKAAVVGPTCWGFAVRGCQ